jgi:hypothetical protein
MALSINRSTRALASWEAISPALACSTGVHPNQLMRDGIRSETSEHQASRRWHIIELALTLEIPHGNFTNIWLDSSSPAVASRGSLCLETLRCGEKC